MSFGIDENTMFYPEATSNFISDVLITHIGLYKDSDF
jgi:hypothetical protein